MTDQLSFADYKYGKPSIDDRFTAFHKAHPEVYELFRQYAEKALATGFERFSADMICHRIRWYHHIDKGDRDFTINDHYTSRYARLLMAADARFAGFFETRKLREGVA